MSACVLSAIILILRIDAEDDLAKRPGIYTGQHPGCALKVLV
jgi:hypothetical protein